MAHYLYKNSATVYTDHSAIKEILRSPNTSGKHARWWLKVYDSGVKEVKTRHKTRQENVNANTLSRSPQAPTPEVDLMEGEVQFAVVDDPQLPPSKENLADLLLLDPPAVDTIQQPSYSIEWAKDSTSRKSCIEFLNTGGLSNDILVRSQLEHQCLL